MSEGIPLKFIRKKDQGPEEEAWATEYFARLRKSTPIIVLDEEEAGIQRSDEELRQIWEMQSGTKEREEQDRQSTD
jgi:hypothetical protein